MKFDLPHWRCGAVRIARDDRTRGRIQDGGLRGGVCLAARQRLEGGGQAQIAAGYPDAWDGARRVVPFRESGGIIWFRTLRTVRTVDLAQGCTLLPPPDSRRLVSEITSAPLVPAFRPSSSRSNCPAIRSPAALVGSSARCAYFAVVVGSAWPSSPPMIGNPKPKPTPLLPRWFRMPSRNHRGTTVALARGYSGEQRVKE